MPRLSRMRLRCTELFALLTIFGIYAFLKRANLEFLAGDSGVYHYAGFLWAQGILPYRDFFLSHPPLELAVPALLIRIFGLNLALLQILPAILGGLSGLLIFLLARPAMGSLGAILACAFTLLSYISLMGTLYATGQELALPLILLATILLMRNRGIGSEMLMGIAVSASISAFAAAAALTVAAFLGRGKARRFLFGFLATAIPLHLLFTFIAGRRFWEQVYFYHFKKPSLSAELAPKGRVFAFMVEHHALLLTLAVCGALLLSWRMFGGTRGGGEDPPRERLLILSATALGAYSLFLMTARTVFPHYFLSLVPFLAMLASDACIRFWGFARRISGTREGRILAGSGILAFLLLAGWSGQRTLAAYRTEQRLMAFPEAPALAEKLKTELRPGETIYGDFGIVPLLALLSGKRIAGNEVDSSVMRFTSGVSKIEEVIAAIEEDHVTAIFGRAGHSITAYPPFQAYLEREFSRTAIHRHPSGGVIVEEWRKR